MDKNFTEKIVAWLETPADERDYEQGALYLLQLNNNQIMYRNVLRNLKKHADFIEYQIRKYVKFRLASLTHEQVQEMQTAVDKIVAERHLDKEPSTEQSALTEEQQKVVEFKQGKRADHDELPDEIQALYAENANIRLQMRELHLKLRMMSTENATCPDSERYPFLKEIIRLDKQYHKNWQVYDSYDPALAAAGAEQQLCISESRGTSSLDGYAERQQSARRELISDERADQKNIYRQINLVKGRYRKNPTDALKQQIADLYAQLSSPVETLTLELVELGIINADETNDVD